MKVALVYDRVNKWGGAERVLLALHEIWPDAPLYTAVYDPAGAPWAKDFKVVPSFLNRLPFAKKNHEKLALLMPLAFESFSFEGYDLVISVTSEAAKGIITKPETRHFCYCLTPTRYLWSGYEQYFDSAFRRLIGAPAVKYLRQWDLVAARRPDAMIAISDCVRRRIRKYYGRAAKVIYPPVDLERFKQGAKSGPESSPPIKVQDNYFLIVSRLVPYKRVDLAVRAFNKLGIPLKIIGTGGEAEKLKKTAGPNIEFLGALTDREVLGYYRSCQAVVFPGEEDFGLVPLEAQACGRPVIALKAGGALETVVEGKTGRFFWPQTTDALVSVVKECLSQRFSVKDCRQNSQRFGQKLFRQKIKTAVLKNEQST